MYSSTQFGSVNSMRLAPKAQYGPKPLGRFELADASARDINCSWNARGKGKKDIMFRPPGPPPSLVITNRDIEITGTSPSTCGSAPPHH
jgi:hypothetical protein